MDEIAELADKYAPLLVSICALFLTISQTILSHRHNRLSVKPNLTSFVHTEQDMDEKAIWRITTTLTNNGLGPAIIKSFEVLFDDKPVPQVNPGDIYPMIEREVKLRFIAEDCNFGLLRPGYVMGKGDTVRTAKVTLVRTLDISDDYIHASMHRFHILVRYESAYGESFTYDSRTHSMLS